MRRGAQLGLGVVLGVTAPPERAEAGNGAHVRTPVDWSNAPCMTIIDRSQDPIHPLEYDIPYEDTEVTRDEVEDSRTHQFFAFCRDRYLEDLLPNWITEAEVLAAAGNGLGDEGNVDFELHVMENSPIWSNCWSRINADHERRPITYEAAAEPVMWDTSELAAGTWVVDGYTYEPWFNRWTAHPGVFKIVDDPDPAMNPPAAALTFVEQAVTYGEDEASITGCVDAMPGSTMTLSWANGNINGEPDWSVFLADVPVNERAFELAFAPPLETVSNSVMIQLEVRDPMGRSWLAYSREYIAVAEEIGDTGCDDEGGIFVDTCGDTDTGVNTGSDTSSETTTGSEGEATSAAPPLVEDGGDGCGCASGGAHNAGALVWFVALGLLRRRRPRARCP